jgi:hypothetical protein
MFRYKNFQNTLQAYKKGFLSPNNEVFEEQKSSELCSPIKKYFFKFIIFLEYITLKPIINRN